MEKSGANKWEEMMNFLVVNHKNFNDEQWAERFELACAEIPEGLEVTHAGCNKIISNRVHEYCNAKGIDVNEYDGPMPYRSYKIPVGSKSPAQA
jgi:hypothetical protein